MPNGSIDRNVDKPMQPVFRTLRKRRFTNPKNFWNFLKALIPTPEVLLLQFWEHFAELFGGDAAYLELAMKLQQI